MNALRVSHRSALFLSLLFGCEAEVPRLEANATFGIVYGGQIQERKEIPFELDGTRQTQAVRVTLDRPASTPLTVAWELSKPGGRGRPPSTAFDEATLRAGDTTWERTLPFAPGDPLGVWNLRVTLEHADHQKVLLLDRPFQVFDAAERTRRLNEIADAGN